MGSKMAPAVRPDSGLDTSGSADLTGIGNAVVVPTSPDGDAQQLVTDEATEAAWR